jgi:nucleotide-binding universal stress UspA family protein
LQPPSSRLGRYEAVDWERESSEGPIMYRKILVAYNGTPESRSALDELVRLMPEASAEIHLAGVVHYPSAYLLAGEYVPEVALADERDHMESDLKDAHALLAGKGFNITDHLLVGEPGDVLTKLVAELGIELLILGHPRSRSFALRWWRGSVDAVLIERVRCSILVASGTPRN